MRRIKNVINFDILFDLFSGNKKPDRRHGTERLLIRKFRNI